MSEELNADLVAAHSAVDLHVPRAVLCAGARVSAVIEILLAFVAGVIVGAVLMFVIINGAIRGP